VLARLDADIRPLHEEAERMVAERVGKKSPPPGRDEAATKPPVPTMSAEEALAAIREGRLVGVPELLTSLPAETRAKVEQVLAEVVATGLAKQAEAEKAEKESGA
jgi:hypothetical protein